MVAINGALLPLYGDFFPPRIVRALMEFGWPEIRIDVQTREVVDRGHSHLAAVNKLSGSAVGQGMFRDGSCPFIGACIYSGASFAAAGYPLGCDYVVVHNPTATVPFARELIKTGQEFWSDGSDLTYKKHVED